MSDYELIRMYILRRLGISLKAKKPNKPPEEPSPESVAPWIALGLGSTLYMAASARQPKQQEIDWQQFKTTYLGSPSVRRLVVVNNEIAHVDRTPIQPHLFFRIGSVESFERKLEIAQREKQIDTDEFIPVQYVQRIDWARALGSFVPSILLIGLFAAMMRRATPGRMMNVGKSKAKKFEGKTGKTFADVAGLDEAKVEIMEFVDFLKQPDKFKSLGARMPKGALLVGPPGTGKTLFAKAVAGEADVPFYSISGSDFIEMFVGVGASRVRDLFEQARENAPSIIFIDEIDAVARARSGGARSFAPTNDERENTLNQLLVEMDGFDSKNNVIVLAGTNRADILDPAILRPGRFDRQIAIEKPDLKGRQDIFKVYLKDMKLSSDIDSVASRMAALTPGFAGAEIENICNEAAIFAARDNSNMVEQKHFEKAAERVIGGIERPNKIISLEEKRIVAYHEAGHAVVGWFSEFPSKLLKVTIIPRASGALGFAQYLPPEIVLQTKEQLMDMMTMALGGRAAEELIYGRVTTGANDDLKKVTNIAYSIVCEYGMTERLGQISFPESQFQKPYSEASAQLIDEEVRNLIQTCYDNAMDILTERSNELELLASALIEKETLNRDDIKKIFT